jgi:hypothetical protein
MAFLTDPATVSGLFSLLITATDRSLHRKVIPLFQTPTLDLFELFARNLPLATLALSQLDASTAQARYGAGTIARMISRALDLWPLDVLDLFRASQARGPDLFALVLRHLSDGVVAQTIYAIFTEQHPEAIVLMWHIFRAVAGPAFSVNRSDCPREVFLVPDIRLDFEFGPDHHLAGIHMLQQFFSIPFPGIGAGFRRLVLRYISECPDISNPLIELAKVLGADPSLKDRIIGLVRNGLNRRAASYLGVCAHILVWWEAAGVVSRLLLDELDQDAVVSVLAVVHAFVSRQPIDERFVRTVLQAVASCWNSVAVAGAHMARAACVAVVAALLQGGAIDEGRVIFTREMVGTFCRADERMELFLTNFEWETPIDAAYDEHFLMEIREVKDVEYVAPEPPAALDWTFRGSFGQGVILEQPSGDDWTLPQLPASGCALPPLPGSEPAPPEFAKPGQVAGEIAVADDVSPRFTEGERAVSEIAVPGGVAPAIAVPNEASPEVAVPDLL